MHVNIKKQILETVLQVLQNHSETELAQEVERALDDAKTDDISGAHIGA